MNRRNFLSLAALALAGKAAQRVFPFRVYSIPKEIVVAPSLFDTMFTIEQYADSQIKAAMAEFDAVLRAQMEKDQEEAWKVISSIIHPYPKAILPPVDWYSAT